MEDEQQGESRVDYAKQVLKSLSASLKPEFGKGFSVRNWQNMRRFFHCYSNRQMLSAELSGPHENKQLFAAKYLTELPSQEELRLSLQRERRHLLEQSGKPSC